VEAGLLRAMAQDSLIRPPCPECGDLLSGFAPETLRAAVALPLADAPEHVRRQLGDPNRPMVKTVNLDHEEDAPSGLTPTLQSGERARRAAGATAPAGPKQIGRYDVGRRIGIGPLATWYVGRESAKAEGLPLLLKVLHPHISRDPAFTEPVERE